MENILLFIDVKLVNVSTQHLCIFFSSFTMAFIKTIEENI